MLVLLLLLLLIAAATTTAAATPIDSAAPSFLASDKERRTFTPEVNKSSPIKSNFLPSYLRARGR